MSNYDVIHNAETLTEMLNLSVGAASVAWTEYEGERRFNTKAAEEISQEMSHWITHHYDSILKPDRSKGEKIVADCLANDEPFFVFRARDIFSPLVLRRYVAALEEIGPDDPDMQADVVDFIDTLRKWQADHIQEVRYPD